MLSDGNQLANQLAADVDAGFPDYVACFERTVFSVALRIVEEREAALDVSADTFHRAYRALRGYDPEHIMGLALRPWTVTIVVNLARNVLRGRSRRPHEVSIDEAATLPSGLGDPELAAEHGERRSELVCALSRLGEVQRTAVVLRFVVDLPYEEIAAVLGCPVGTAKSHTARGLDHLRKVMSATSPTGERP